MKLGILTAPFADTSLADVADWAGSVGFEALEIACWPKSTGPSRRYAGTTPYRRGQHIRFARRRTSSRRLPTRASRFRRSATIPTRCIPMPTTAGPSSII